MPPADLGYLKSTLIEQYGLDSISDTDVLSAALYPKVFAGFKLFLSTYGDLSSLPTRFFLTPLKVGQEFSFELGLGKTLIIKLVTIGPLGDTGRRDVYFSLNGETRLVSVLDTNVTTGLTKPVLRLKADPLVKGHIGSPMSGLVVELKVKVGDVVKLGDPIGIMSAMKV